MSQSGIPEDVQTLIEDHIDSVDQLELLLLLRRSSPAALTPDELARELRIDTPLAQAQLETLASHGLVEADEGGTAFRYEQRDAAQDRAVRGLAAAYDERRVTVITLIFSKPSDKIRSFANAFRLRKGK